MTLTVFTYRGQEETNNTAETRMIVNILAANARMDNILAH